MLLTCFFMICAACLMASAEKFPWGLPSYQPVTCFLSILGTTRNLKTSQILCVDLTCGIDLIFRGGFFFFIFTHLRIKTPLSLQIWGTSRKSSCWRVWPTCECIFNPSHFTAQALPWWQVNLYLPETAVLLSPGNNIRHIIFFLKKWFDLYLGGRFSCFQQKLESNGDK